MLKRIKTALIQMEIRLNRGSFLQIWIMIMQSNNVNSAAFHANSAIYLEISPKMSQDNKGKFPIMT